MIQEILAQITVGAASVYAVYGILKAIIPALKKEGVSCDSNNNCGCDKGKTSFTKIHRKKPQWMTE